MTRTRPIPNAPFPQRSGSNTTLVALQCRNGFSFQTSFFFMAFYFYFGTRTDFLPLTGNTAVACFSAYYAGLSSPTGTLV